MINVIITVVLIALLLFNSIISFYLVQKITLYNAMLKGNNKPSTNIQPKKHTGRPVGSKNKPKEGEVK